MKNSCLSQYTSFFTLLALLFLSPFFQVLLAQQTIRFEPSKPSEGASQEFSTHFNAYSLVEVDRAALSTLLRSEASFDSLSIIADGTTYTFSLEANDVRADNYVLRISTPSGIQELPRSPNMTYSGYMLGTHGDVRITSHDTYFMAMLEIGDDFLFIQPATRIDKHAPENQFVVYKEKDVKKPFDGAHCPTVSNAPLDQQEEQKDRSSRTGQCKAIGIALANDFPMYSQFGNVSAVETHNLTVLNLVNTNYDNEFADEIRHYVVEIFVATSAANDPWYTGNDYLPLLYSFTGWAPTGFKNQHDVGSLWTNRPVNSGVVGLAWVDELCKDSSYNFVVDFAPYATLRLVQAHELGHNYGYGHDGPPDFIMSPFVSNPPSNTWSAPSHALLSSRFDAETCMQRCGAGQNVGIGTRTPDPSAILELSSTSKGFLPPRLTTIQREAIDKPGEGLFVFDATTNSLWVQKENNWTELYDSENFFIEQGGNNDVYLGMNGNVGIGTNAPLQKLDVNGMTYFRNNVGIGNANPTAPLQFAATSANRKLVLMDVSNNDHQFFGFGTSPFALRYQTEGIGADHIFYSGIDATQSRELMRVTGYGKVTIGNYSLGGSAIFEVNSTTKGMLIPRMTTTERTAITSPATGLLVFDNSTNSFWFRGTSAWVELTDGLDTELFRNGPDKLYAGLTDSVGIGTIDPAYKLEVKTANNKPGIAHTDGTIKLTTHVSTLASIGTESNHALGLRANNQANQFTLNTNGNIGIGLAPTTNKVDIATASRTGTHGSNLALYATGALGDASNGFEVRHTDGTQGIGIGRNTIYAAGSSTSQSLTLAAKGTSGELRFLTDNVERMKVTGTGALRFPATLANRKVVLYQGIDNDHEYNGFGINAGVLRYQVDGPGVDHIFYAAAGPSASTELMRIQGSGRIAIGTSGAHTSALVEMASTNKGVLIPRMSTANRTAIASPQTGLLVFDNTTNSFWYRGASAWVEITDNLDAEVFRNGPDKIYAGLTDSVGIGTMNPEFKLHVRTDVNDYGFAHSDGDVKIASWVGTHGEFGTVSNHPLSLFANNQLNQFILTPDGNIGIGTYFPHAPLQFDNASENRKIVLSETTDNNHQYKGFGVNGAILRYQTDAVASDHVFYAAANTTTSNELMRVKGNGNVTVAGVIETEAVIPAPLGNGFTQYGFGYGSAAYYKDKMGRVHLRGLVNTPASPNGQVIFQLPVGYRPVGTVVFMTLSNNALARVDVLANGNVQASFATGTSWLSLDGLSFKAE